MPEVKNYRIGLDGEWLLTEFHDFTHLYFQIYSVLAALAHYDEATVRPDSLNKAFATYPWEGGYSTVNFFRNLYRNLPRNAKPKVNSIRYSSPGYIDLTLWIATAIAINKLVSNLVTAVDRVDTLYDKIYRGMQQRKLLRIDVRERQLGMAQSEVDFITKSLGELSQHMGFEHLRELQELSDNDLMALKILMSIYRRIRGLAEFVRSGKIKT